MEVNAVNEPFTVHVILTDFKPEFRVCHLVSLLISSPCGIACDGFKCTAK